MTYYLLIIYSSGGHVINKLNQEIPAINVTDLAPSIKHSIIRVLHVDDDYSILKISKQILLNMGNFEIDQATSVDEAFKKLATGNYDVVISEYELPKKDGLQFLQQLREQNNLIPFILFTRKGREEVAVKAINFGSDGYLNKQGSPESVYTELAHRLKKIAEHEKSKTALSESEKKYRTLIEQSLNGLLIAQGPTPHIVFANSTITKILGYSVQELISLPLQGILDLIHPDDRELFFARFKSRLEGKPLTQKFLFRGFKKNGTMIWVELSSALIEYEGEPAVQAIFDDVTECREQELELKQKYEALDRVAESIGAGLAIIGKDYRIIWANKHLRETIFDVNKKCYQNFNKLDSTCPDCGVKKIFEQNSSLDVHEFKTVNSKGETIWIELRVTPLRDNNENVTAALELAVPITERKIADEKLRETQHLTQKILDCSPNLIYIYDLLENKNIYSNKQLLEFLGYSPNQIKSMGSELFANILHPDDAQIVDNHHRCFASAPDNATYDVEYRMKHASGEWRWLRSRDVLFARTKEGVGKQILGTCEDITESKKAEELRKVLETKLNNYSKHLKCMVDMRTVQLKDANDRLVKSERLVAIGELAGMVGHDLRNPLAGIKNATFYLKKKGTSISEDKSAEMLEIIEKAIDYSDKIINDLLDYSREMQLELTKHSAKTLLDEALRMIQIPDRIQIANQVPEDIMVWVNPDKITRVFLNLIKNAIEAMPERGKLEISNSQKRGYVNIVFADTGAGISEEILGKLFLPLITTKAQGMGFGLAICKRIVEAHGGRITVRSAVNKGTSFTITLPAKPKLPTK